MKRRLGEMLVALGIIDEAGLSEAIEHCRRRGILLGQALVERGMCSPEQVTQALAAQSGLQLVDLSTARLDPALAALLPRGLAEQHKAVPLRTDGRTLFVAMAAPASLTAVDAVRAASGRQRVVPLLASDADILDGLARVYDGAQAPAKEAPPAPVFGGELELGGTSFDRQQRLDEALAQAGVELSPVCWDAIRRASAHFKLSERAVVVHVLEAWSKRNTKPGA